jgi:hypothetical protein
MMPLCSLTKSTKLQRNFLEAKFLESLISLEGQLFQFQATLALLNSMVARIYCFIYRRNFKRFTNLSIII